MLRTSNSALGIEVSRDTAHQRTQAHHLVRTTFSKLTVCDHCGRILWGLVKQGLTCQTCGYVCHPDCTKEVAELECVSQALDKESLDNLLAPAKKSRPAQKEPPQGEIFGLSEAQTAKINDLINGERSHVPITRAVTENGILLNTSPTTPVPSKIFYEEPSQVTGSGSLRVPSKDHNQMISTFRRHASMDFGSPEASDPSQTVHSPISPSKLSLDNFVRDFKQTKDRRERELERARQNPSLNLMTTLMQNMTQFVPRVTGVRVFRDNLVKIFTWENQKNSWAVFFLYVLVCLRPVWLVILPFVILWYLQVKEYLDSISETGSEVCPPIERGVRGEKCPPECNVTSPSFYPSIPGSDFSAAREMAAKYALNMQFLQNLMGTHVKLHDHNERSWREFKENTGPKWPLWVTAVGLPTSLFFYYTFSTQSLFLMLGCYMFLGNNPYVMALVVNFSSLLVDELNTHFNLNSLALKVRAITLSKLSSRPRTITISVFENQRFFPARTILIFFRWWAMLGWNDQMVSTERCAWSDETGKLEQTPIFQQHPEPGYVWEEGSSWEVVRDWCLPVRTDEGGWVYYNNIWIFPSSKPQINSFTRRRLWTRKMVPEQS